MAACLSLVGCQQDLTASGADTARSAAPEVDSRTAGPARPAGVPSPAHRSSAVPPLLHAAAGGDGDSWKDTRGVEYRLGLVNTPELSECYGGAASRKRRQLTAAGFRAATYTTDTYGRHVA